MSLFVTGFCILTSVLLFRKTITVTATAIATAITNTITTHVKIPQAAHRNYEINNKHQCRGDYISLLLFCSCA